MSKLHELLAVEGNLENQADKTRTDLMATFEKKRHLFEEKRISFTSNEEGGGAAVVEEQLDIQSTVRKEIDWLGGILAKSLDASHQVDVANTVAKADVVTEDGVTILKQVPATSLLQLEKRLKEVHDLVKAVPTLDPALGFAPDPAREKGVYKAREISKQRTKKTQRPLVLYGATKEHAAQTQLISEDVPVGTILEQRWSALITPATKSDLLDRCDKLIRAVRKARARANDQEVPVSDNTVGKALLDYVFEPLNS